MAQRDSFPNIRIVWIERDIPSTMWSIFKRFHGKGITAVQPFKHACKVYFRELCVVRKLWHTAVDHINDPVRACVRACLPVHRHTNGAICLFGSSRKMYRA